MNAPSGRLRPPLPPLALLLLALLPLTAQRAVIAEVGSPPREFLTAQKLAGLNTDVVTLILQGNDGGELAAQVLAVPLFDSHEKTAIGLWAETDIGTLLAADPTSLSLELYAYVIGAEGAVKAHLSQTVELPVADMDPQTVDAGVRFIAHLDPVASGSYRLRILIREPSSQKFALRTIALEVPAAKKGVAFLAPPVFEAPESGWLEVREAPPHGSDSSGSSDGSAGSNTSVGPQEQAHRLWGSNRPLAAVPTFHPNQEVDLRLLIQHLPEETADVKFSLSTLDGQLVERFATLRSERSGTGVGGIERLTVQVRTPQVPYGRYVLDAALTTPAGDTVGAPSHTVFITDPSLTANPIIADGPAQRAQLAQRAPERSNLAEVQRKKRFAIITSAYRDVLSSLAEGLMERALLELHGLETDFVRTLEDTPVAFLQEAEVAVLSELHQRQPEALIPALALHLRLHRRYIEDRANTLLTHTASIATELAERYAGAIQTNPARSLAADALAALGADLQEARLRTQALKLFERALTLDPNNRFALLSLAVGREGTGEYDETVAALERLVAIDPGFAEGRLRLAINLSRTGQTAKAARGLQDLIDDEAANWILTLAYQELARIHLDAGHPQRAAYVLDLAVRRLPQEGSLFVQLAYALDRSGQLERGNDAVLSAERSLRTGGTSPRSRYQAPTTHDPGQARESLLRGCMARLPALAQALGKRVGT